MVADFAKRLTNNTGLASHDLDLLIYRDYIPGSLLFVVIVRIRMMLDALGWVGCVFLSQLKI